MAVFPLLGYASSAVSVTAGGTRYFPFAGSSITATTTEEARKLYAPTDGTLRNLWVRVVTSTISAGSGTVRSRKSGANGNQTVSITGTGTFEDTSHTDSVSAGDTFDIQMLGATTGDFAFSTTSAVFDTPGDVAVVGGMQSGRSVGAATTVYVMPTGAHGFAAIEANAQLTARVNGTLSNLRGFMATNSLTATMTLTFRKNGADGSQVCSWPAGTSGTVEDTSGVDSFVDGDLLCLAWVNNDAVNAANTNGHTMYLRADNRAMWLGMATDSTVTQAEPLTRYYAFASRIDPQTTESTAQAKTGAAPINARNLQAIISANTVNATTTFTLRQNAADTALVVSVPSNGTGTFEDTTHIVPLVASDQIDVAVVTPSVSGSRQITISAVTMQLDQQDTPELYGRPDGRRGHAQMAQLMAA